MRQPSRSLPALLLALTACAHPAAQAPTEPASPAAEKAPTADEARAFVKKVNDDVKDLWLQQNIAEWIKATYITDDTEREAAWANEATMAYLSKAIPEAARYAKAPGLDADTARQLKLLRLSATLPAPKDPAGRAELATVVSKLEGLYGKGKYCPEGQESCLDLTALEEIMAKSRDYDTLLDAWAGWRTISPPMKPMFAEEVKLANEGAKEIGFENVAELWKSGYDEPPAAFDQDVERLWQQVRPLYEQLHCYVRAKLVERYGKDKVPEDGPIPAHLLGNMWAQEWGNIYPMVEPYPGASGLDVTKALVAQKWTPKKMVETGERFFTSLGFPDLPESFWERSMFVKPRDRDVVCHASAWHVDLKNDVRIKMCIQPKEEDLVTIHHELGHIFYYTQYEDLPPLYQGGANDGFHEAIGDAVVLSMTPAYLEKLGLVKDVATSQEALINVQMKTALDKVAFLPFGRMIDKWRWEVFEGKVTPDQYNAEWWKLRRQYQGVAAPVARPADAFDPGAKYHIPANTPYMRYFLATILQFQFHRAMCKEAGFEGPLHACSIYENPAAGEKFRKMLQLGMSKPWPDALETLTGQREMDASAILDYFAPLRSWLEKQNAGRQCGW